MKQLPNIAIVILNYNGQHFLQKFLPSVLATTYPNIQVIVGDNASTDHSISFLQTHFPQVTILQNPENYGFAGGYNKILERVTADYYVLLNSDVQVTPNWLEPMVELLKNNNRVVACMPKILSYHQPEFFEYAGASGGFIDRYGYPFCRGRIFDELEKDENQYNEPIEIFWASGAALLVKATVYWEVGGLDPDFFAHMEEIDCCWRIKKLGYQVMVCPQSTVYHVGGGTLDSLNPRKTYLNFRNSLICLYKNLPNHQLLSILWMRSWLDLLAVIKFYLQGKIAFAFAVHKAHWHFFCNIKQWHKKRKEVQKLSATTKFNNVGKYNGSIVFDYFLRSKKKFSQLSILSK